MNDKKIINKKLIDNKIINNYNIGIFDPKGINNNPLQLNNSYSDTYKELAKFWSNLPAYEMGKKIVKAIYENDVVLISSGTGSGKTVLVPKFAIHSLGYEVYIPELHKRYIVKIDHMDQIEYNPYLF